MTTVRLPDLSSSCYPTDKRPSDAVTVTVLGLDKHTLLLGQQPNHSPGQLKGPLEGFDQGLIFPFGQNSFAFASWRHHLSPLPCRHHLLYDIFNRATAVHWLSVDPRPPGREGCLTSPARPDPAAGDFPAAGSPFCSSFCLQFNP